MTHHIRRLLMNPISAFEGEISMDSPPSVSAAAKCLAMCIEVRSHPGSRSFQMSPNDDLISSTLYSLLNLLTHNTGTTIGPGSMMGMRSSPQADDATVHTNYSSGNHAEDQRRLVAVTAVKIVSKLSLATRREDVSVSPS